MSDDTIYRVDVGRDNTAEITLLVQAKNMGAARRHARSLITVRKATQHDLINLLGHGVTVEKAGNEETEEPAATDLELN